MMLQSRVIDHSTAFRNIKMVSIFATCIAFTAPIAGPSASAKFEAVLTLMFHFDILHRCHAGMMSVRGPIHHTLTLRRI